MSKDEILQMIVDYYDIPVHKFDQQYPNHPPERRGAPCYVRLCMEALKGAKPENPVFYHDYKYVPYKEWICKKCGNGLTREEFDSDNFCVAGCSR